MALHNIAKTNTAIKNLCLTSPVLQTRKWAAERWRWRALPGNPFSQSYVMATSIKKQGRKGREAQEIHYCHKGKETEQEPGPKSGSSWIPDLLPE